MIKEAKLITKAFNSPNSLSFNDFQTLLKQNHWQLDHQTGSHQIWYSPTGYRISIQSSKGKAKAYQVKQFLKRYEQENYNNDK